MRARVLTLLTMALALVAGVFVAPVAAEAAGPVYPVMNTSEYPPDIIYFRNSPNWDDTSRVHAWGVYAGERVRLDCWGTGSNVPRKDGRSNLLWYKAQNVSRLTAPDGRNNYGWINAHFVDDGMAANQAADNVPPCDGQSVGGSSGGDSSQPASVPGGASVYYSPFAGDWITSTSPSNPYAHYVHSQASTTLYKNQWIAGSCDPSKSADFPQTVGGRRVTAASGWSIGRMGPLYLLLMYPERAKQIKYILLLDPGTYGELSGDCYAKDLSRTLKEWLDLDPQHNHLAILAGEKTRDWPSRVTQNGRTYAHRGIQEVYFPKIRGTSAASQVTVCNYDGMKHQDVWMNFQGWVNQAPITAACPGNANALWHP